VLFAAADDTDRFHERAKLHLSRLSASTLLGTFTLLEFDVVLKSNGYSANQRREQLLLLVKDYPRAATRIHQVCPSTLVLASTIEENSYLDYFDALIAAESVEHDGTVVSSDREFDKVLGLTRIPLA